MRESKTLVRFRKIRLSAAVVLSRDASHDDGFSSHDTLSLQDIVSDEDVAMSTRDDMIAESSSSSS